jgi:hypothetical protein
VLTVSQVFLTLFPFCVMSSLDLHLSSGRIISMHGEKSSDRTVCGGITTFTANAGNIIIAAG